MGTLCTDEAGSGVLGRLPAWRPKMYFLNKEYKTLWLAVDYLKIVSGVIHFDLQKYILACKGNII